MRDIKLGNFDGMWSLNSECDEVVLTSYWSNKSVPNNDLKPSATTVNVADRVFQPLLHTGVCILVSMRIVSLEKILSSGFAFSWTQNACELLLTTRNAIDWLGMLHTLPESARSVVEMLPILSGMFRGSIFARSFSIIATILSSPLL